MKTTLNSAATHFVAHEITRWEIRINNSNAQGQQGNLIKWTAQYAFCKCNNVCNPSSTVQGILLVQVVRDFVGYASVWWAQVLYIVLVLLSLGLIWVVGLYNMKANLWRFRKCTLRKANFVYVQVQIFECALLINIQHLHSAFACSLLLDIGYLCLYMSSLYLRAISHNSICGRYDVPVCTSGFQSL